ncbi:MAG: hypothetical protein RBU27_11145 [Bacteroidota bacterium]|jgi:hypothetical protein|nr:hypothetical protein [Bacteroidota bacterium]
MKRGYEGANDVLSMDESPNLWRYAQGAVLVLGMVLLLVVMGEEMVARPILAVSILMMAAAAALMLIDFRLALLLLVAFLFGYEEFNLSSEQAFVEENIAGTVMSVQIFGFALMDVISLVFLVPVLLREWRHAVTIGRWRWLRADLLLLPVIAVWAYGIVPGLLNMHTRGDFTWDLRMLAHVLVFYFIFSRSFIDRRDYLAALLVGGSVFLLKHGLFFFRYLTGGGLQTGMYHRVLLGSDLPLTALALALTITALFVYRDAWSRPESAARSALNTAVATPSRARTGHGVLLLLAAYFTVMLVAGLGKLTYLQASYSLALVFVLHRREIRLRTVLMVIAAGVASSLLVFLTVLPSEGRETIVYALTSAFNWVDALKLYGDLSFGTRLLEIINVWAVLQREGAVLWGLGWGAAWTEIAAHLPFDGGAFAVEEQYTGVHVSTHIDALTFLLKVGVIGTLIIYASYLRFFTAAFGLYRGQRAPWERWTLMALMLMLLIFIPNYLYFIRLKYLLGFALAGVAIFLSTPSGDPGSSDHSRMAVKTGSLDPKIGGGQLPPDRDRVPA